MRTFTILSTCLLLTCASVSPTSSEWRQWRDPEKAGFDRAQVDAVCKRADALQSGAFIAVSHGSVVTACGDVARKLELHSVRKSVYSALYGIAIDKGLIRLDATLAELGIDDLQPLTPAEKRARVEDLLLARSGIYHRAAYAPSDQDRAPARGTHAPGANWFYNNWDFNVAGVLLERATGRKLGALVEEWIARPIGMQDFTADDVSEVMEPTRSQWPALTMRMSARDLARFGQLWLSRGSWNGRQVIPAAWVDRASRLVSRMDGGQGYGMMWWVQPEGTLPAERYPALANRRIVSGRGTGGQLVAVIPSAGMVIVHRGDTDHGREVGSRGTLELMNMVLAARKGDSTSDADGPLAPVPLASQLPPLEWPRVVELDPATRDALIGEYRFGPDRVARIFLHNGKLYGHVPPFGDAELFAKSPTEFFIRVDPTAQVRVEGSKLILNIRGREMIGERK